MKKITIFTIIILLLGISLGHSETRSLTIVSSELVPYHYTNKEGKVVGFGVELVQELFKRIGVKIESLKIYPWKRSLDYVKKGKADVLFFLNHTKDREEFFWYSVGVLETPWVLWIRESGCCKYEENANLIGKRVGIVSGYSYTEEFRKFLSDHHVGEPAVNNEMNFRKLMAHRVDYVAAELGNGYRIVNEMGLDGVVPLLNNPIKVDEMYIAFSKATVPEDLVRRFSLELEKFKKSLEFEALWKRFFHLR